MKKAKTKKSKTPEKAANALPELKRTPTPVKNDTQGNAVSELQSVSRSNSLVLDPLPSIGQESTGAKAKESKKIKQPISKLAKRLPPPPGGPPPPPPPPPKKKEDVKEQSESIGKDADVVEFDDFVPESKTTGESNLNWLSGDQLLQGKRGLKAVQEKEGIRLDRDQLFDKHEVPDYFPLRSLRDAFHDNYISSIGLIGVDQVTDLVFYCIHHLHHSASFCRYVKGIHLNGNVHITDLALQYIVDMFPNLERVNVHGCKNITNDGLAELLLRLKSVQNIIVSATDISVVTPLATDRSNVITRVYGCPAIVPNEEIGPEAVSKNQYFCDLLETPSVKTHKVVVISNPDQKKSLLAMLRKDNTQAGKSVQALSGWKTDGREFNIIECPGTLMHAFSTPRTIYTVLFSLDEDINKNLPKVTKQVTQVLLQQPSAVLCLVGVTESGKPVCTTEKMLDLLEDTMTSTADKQSVGSQLSKIQKDIITHLYAGEGFSLDFKTQRVLANVCRLSKAVTNKLAHRIIACTVNSTQDTEIEKALGKALTEAGSQIYARYPAYEHLPEGLLSLINAIPKVKGIQDARSVAKSLREKNGSTYGQKLRTYVKMLELMAILGKAVLFTADEKTFVVTDVEWFTGVLAIIQSSATKSEDCPKCLHPDTPVLPLATLKDILKPLVPVDIEAGDTMLSIVKALGLGWVDDKAVVLSSLLKTEPPVPLAPQLREGTSDAAVSITHTLHMLLPEAALHDFMGLVSRDITPQLMWNRGVLVQLTPAQLVIQFHEGDLGKAGYGITKVTLDASIITEGIDPNNNGKLITLLKEMVACYRVLLEYIFKKWNISYSYGDSLTFKCEQKNMPAGTSIGDEMYFANTHTLDVVKEGGGGSSLGSVSCSECGGNQKHLRQLWENYCDVYPALCGKTWQKIGNGTVQQKGSWFTIPPLIAAAKTEAVTNSLKWKTSMTPEAFSRFTFVMDAGHTPGIGVELTTNSKSQKHTYTLRKKTKTGDTVFMQGDDEVKKMPRVLENGTTIDVRISIKKTPEGGKDGANEKPDLCYFIEFSMADEVLWDIDTGLGYRRGDSIVFMAFSQQQMTFFLNAPTAFKSRMEIAWKEGMRLEAKDRLNPNLICVATVTSVLNDGKEVNIHFDGWTNRYDYIAEVTSPDLHPIGYIAHLQSTYKPGAKLEAPKDYRSHFTWEKYLRKVGDPPVHHSLFTPEQTEGCPEFELSQDVLDAMKAPTIWERSCKKAENLHMVHHMMRKMMKTIPGDAKEKLNESTWPPTILLPKSLTLNQLKYPRLVDMKAMSVHFLCLNNGLLHMVDKEGIVDEDTIKSMVKIWTIALSLAMMLTSQENFLPTEVKSLVKDAAGISHEELSEHIRHQILLTAIPLMFKAQPSDASEEVYKQVANEVFETAQEKFNLGNVLTKTDDKYLCTEHMVAGPEMNLTHVPLDAMKHVWNLTSELNLVKNHINELPADLFTTLPALRLLLLTENKIEELPSFKGAKNLVTLDVSKNKLKSLPNDLLQHANQLEMLSIGQNSISEIPDCVYKCKTLTKLYLNDLGVSFIHDDLANLKSLKCLDLSGHSLTEVPKVLGTLTELTELDISGIAWFSGYDSARSILSRPVFDEVMASNVVTAAIPDKMKASLFDGTEGSQQSTLDHKGIVRLNSALYTTLPRIGQNCTTEEGSEEGQKEAEELMEPLYTLTNLVTLKMKYLAVREIPGKISALEKLEVLDLSHCPSLHTISSDLVKCSKITALNIKDCGALKTPPKEIVRRGFQATIGYLKKLQMGSITCKRTKLMMVGLGGAGKTSTIKAIMSRSNRYSGDLYVTDGIDIMSWDVCYENSTKEDNTITFSVWDFAGQTVYYNTHQFFLSNRAVYLLMWNVRLGHEHAGLEFWLSSIACHAPKAPVLVIGTHVDQVEKFWLPQEALQKRFPQIVGFHAVSSYTGEGIADLSKEIYYVGLKEKYMGEKIPKAWLSFEKSIKKLGKGSGKKEEESANQIVLNVTEESAPEQYQEPKNLLTWEELEKLAENVGIIDDLELKQATRFLHDLGSLQHFESDFLKSRVVINPQWIVNVMSCVVSVHENEIKDGKILHCDLDKIWNDYPKELHRWLLRLTEEFDLTFPLLDEPANLVACLLPDKEPEYTWQDVSDIPGQHETKMLYKFEYLPAGLFNRAQVRLSQFSDSSIIWKKGSLLHKTSHKALMKQLHGSQVEVRAQGHCPENFLFLVHEVFETLISEAYNGVTYDFLVPCEDCVKVGTNDPCMFEASKIRRAVELKVPFLQCDKYFHTLSLTEVQAAMPPDSSTDFDAHLERNLRDLSDLKTDMETDVFLFYCSKDVPGIGEDDKKVAPRKIYQDLTDEGYKVWFSHDPDSVDLKSIAITMKNAKLVVVMVSDSFVQDDQCCNVFYYAQNTLRKKMQMIVLTGNNWQKTDIGMQMASEVYIKMNDPKRYQHKKVELMDSITSKTAKKKIKHPECFISYCWSNSHDAIKKGSRKIEGALGWGDPRTFKKHLEDNGINCWMDIEQVGQGGLFEDIAEGLKHAKVVVACVSDEYAKSKNCQMELRFASSILRLPIIVVIVGQGYAWEASEVGMLVLGSPKINAQYESGTVLQRLVDAVKQALPEEKKEEQTEEEGKDDAQQQAFQELLELAQRKFLRQVSGYANMSESIVYPRLFFMDFATKEDKDTEGKPLVPKEDKNDDEERYVVRILCEHEQGWHVSGSPLLVPLKGGPEMDHFIERIAPFGARMMAILKHTSIDCPCLTTDKGDKLRKKLEDSCALDMDFKNEYQECRQFVIDLDEVRSMGGLTQCHMPNGKILWLCKEHATQDDRISSIDDTTTLVKETTSIDLSQSQNAPRLTKLRGKMLGAAEAARVAGAMSIAHQSSKTCSVM